MTLSVEARNTRKITINDKLSWWKNLLVFNVNKTIKSSSILDRGDFDIDETTLKFIKKHRKAFESLARK